MILAAVSSGRSFWQFRCQHSGSCHCRSRRIMFVLAAALMSGSCGIKTRRAHGDDLWCCLRLCTVAMALPRRWGARRCRQTDHFADSLIWATSEFGGDAGRRSCRGGGWEQDVAVAVGEPGQHLGGEVSARPFEGGIGVDDFGHA